jgi:lysophospholipase L1-like esterase
VEPGDSVTGDSDRREPSRSVTAPLAVAIAITIVAVAILGVVLATKSSSGPASSAVQGSGARGGPGAPATTTALTTTPLTYYLALGDSLAKGIGASNEAHDYVNLIYQHEAPRYPELRLSNLGCGGATTKSVIYGPGCGAGTQLGNAEAFLRANPGRVAFVTIDIGGNDILPCIDGRTVNPRCVEEAFGAVATNLPKILAGLRSAYPGIRIYGMNYYNPYLADWLMGIAGENMAEETVTVVTELDTELGKIYAAAGAPMADPFSAFSTRNFEMTGRYKGQPVPKNVEVVCEWTLMCESRNVHTNDAGHAVLASTFETQIDRDIAAQMRISTRGLPTGHKGSPYSAALAGTGGLTPYRWQVEGSVPRGLALDTATGVITGRISSTAASIYSFRVRVTDQSSPGRSSTRDLSIAVQ